MKTISLLFLTYSNPIHKQQLEDFMINCNIYIHPKYPENMDSTFSKFVIPNLIQTKWGDKSIIYATLELLKTAYQNNNNQWFILCSEDIYPLVDYTNLKEYLDTNKLSIFHTLDKSKNKTSQFWALNREDVKIILSNPNTYESIFKDIPRKAAFDELFFLTLLKKLKSNYNFNE